MRKNKGRVLLAQFLSDMIWIMQIHFAVKRDWVIQRNISQTIFDRFCDKIKILLRSPLNHFRIR